jgi:hypothetical protein
VACPPSGTMLFSVTIWPFLGMEMGQQVVARCSPLLAAGGLLLGPQCSVHGGETRQMRGL